MIDRSWHFLQSIVAFPNFLPLFGVVSVGVCFVAWYRYRKSRRLYQTLTKTAWSTWLISSTAWWRQGLKALLYAVALVSLAFALLQPQWGHTDEIVQQEGRDVFIAVDVSRSMLARDIEPNRLEAVKKKVKKLLYNLSCERVGLLLFSGTSFVQCPLTVDHQLFMMYLDQIDVETISSGSTSLAKPIQQALDTFSKVGSGKTKLLVLFTDGEDFSGDVEPLLEDIKEEGLAVATVGVGTEQGAPVPIIQEDGRVHGFEKEEDGSIVLTKLDSRLLENIAASSGGIYVPFDKAGHADIARLITWVEGFEKGQFGEKSSRQTLQQYPYFAALSFACLALEWVL